MRRAGTPSLVWWPPAFAGVFVALGLALGPAALTALLRTENEAGKVLSVLGCLAAALAFERGDYLRRAWLFTAACLLLLLVRDVTVIPPVEQALAGPHLDTARGALVVAANASSVVGTAMLARAWSVAGLDAGESRGRRALLLLAGVAVSLAITGWSLAAHVRALCDGNIDALVLVASDLGDTICFALIVPVLQTALALRGGALLWPWALLTAGGFCWILYDAAWGVSELLHVDHLPRVRLAVEAFRALACIFIAVAGLAQRWAVRQAP